MRTISGQIELNRMLCVCLKKIIGLSKCIRFKISQSYIHILVEWQTGVLDSTEKKESRKKWVVMLFDAKK